MDFVDETGITPLVGVNYNNHYHPDWMSEEESVAKAKRQAEYVVNTRGYKGAFFTLEMRIEFLIIHKDGGSMP